MLWDADVAYSKLPKKISLFLTSHIIANNRYDRAIKNALTGGSPRPQPQGPSSNPDPSPDDLPSPSPDNHPSPSPDDHPKPTPAQKSPSTPAIIENPIESDRDPRATSRVKRPSFNPRNEAKNNKSSRFFRF